MKYDIGYMENRVLYPYTVPAKKQVSIGVDELLALIVSDATTNKSASSPYKDQKTTILKCINTIQAI